MKSKFFFLIVATFFLLTACKDDASKFRVKTKYHIHKVSFDGHEESYGGKTDTFYYTPEGKRDYSASGTITKEERSGNIIIWTTLDRDGKVVGTTTSFLNDKGLEDSVEIRDATHVTYAHKYIYDKDGYVIEDRQYQAQPPNIIWKYKVVDGNRVELTATYFPSTDTVMMPNPTTGEMEEIVTQYFDMIIHKDYFLDKLNFPSIQNFGYTNKDINSKNLEKSSVQLSMKGDTQEVYFFRYIFDDKGRVTSAAQISRSGNEYDSTAYTYY